MITSNAVLIRRHYYVQTQLGEGLDVYSLSRLLGHETVDITNRYL